REGHRRLARRLLRLSARGLPGGDGRARRGARPPAPDRSRPQGGPPGRALRIQDGDRVRLLRGLSARGDPTPQDQGFPRLGDVAGRSRAARRRQARLFAFTNNPDRRMLAAEPEETAMEFGYFTLSDNRYPDNPRTPEQFLKDIYAEALWAEQVGLHSAWIGEHHFNLLGVNASPRATLAQLAGATTRLRLAPAVTLLPVHHPLHVAEEWATLDLLSGGRVDFAAGRGYDRKEYEPFGASFEESAELFAEGLEIVWRAWTEPGT